MKWLLPLVGLFSVWVQADVRDVRIWPGPDGDTRIVLDLTKALEHRAFDLSAPNRVVLDISNARMLKDLEQVDLTGSPVRTLRSGRHGQNDLRFVIELREGQEFRTFPLPPNDIYGHRLVIDLSPRPVPKVVGSPALSIPAPVKQTSPRPTTRDVIVAIDAGHGGEDPGAIGPGRVMEKHVVLAIAKELQRLLQDEPGFTPLMIRTGDYYLGLRERAAKARAAGADFFISIHADAFKHPSARGGSVFMLSDRGASSEMASYLADKENQSDSIGGVKLENADDHLAMTLVDLTMTNKRKESVQLGSHILEQMGSIAKLHKSQVEEANFMVLKTLSVPALLVETGFISNPQEARALADRNYQKKMARAIFTGTTRYFRRYPPDNVQLAQAPAISVYVVKRGDTLSDIAVREGVAVADLRRANDLKSDQLRIGQQLQIPRS